MTVSLRGMASSIYLKILLLTGFILGFSLVMLLALDYFKFENTLAQVVRARTEISVLSIRGTIENNMNIGLPLSAVRNVGDIIDRTKAIDPDIRDIAVFETGHGTILTSADDRAGAARPAPAAWLAAQARAAGGGWHVRLDDSDVVGQPIHNSFGGIEGGVAVVSSRDGARALMTAIRHRLQQVMPALLAGFLVLAGLGCAQLGRTIRRTFAAVEAAVAGHDAAIAGGDRQLVGQARDFGDTARAALAALAEIEHRRDTDRSAG